MVKFTRILILLVADILSINLAYIVSYLLRFEFDVSGTMFTAFFAVYGNNIFVITLLSIAMFWLFGIYSSMWRYAEFDEIIKVTVASLGSTLLVLAFMHFTGQVIPRSIYIISCVLMGTFVSATRLAYRFVRNLRNPGSFNSFVITLGRKDIIGSQVTKVMLVGAGDAGATMIKEIKQHPEYCKKVVIAVDDNSNKVGNRILGVRIAGGHEKIVSLAQRYNIDEIIVAIPSANKKAIQPIVNECNKTNCKVKILPGLIDLINEKVSISKLRDVDIEDLLGRESVEVNLREISGYLEGKIVMVTGGGGSIGSELCRQIAAFRPRKLIALDIYENTLFELNNEMMASFPELEFDAVIGSVRHKERMRQVFEKYMPHVVFHAAAHKHVPLMEKNPKEAIVNNILGTKNMIDLSEEYSVIKFVMISTDKAVNPTNVMGATKRVAEMIMQEKSKSSRTSFSAVRFGNVLGSNGSVIPIFRKQIAMGGPVTVTHPDITRFFMTIPEAVQLVIQTGAMAEGGEIFILDMGEPVKIMDLAENVIRLSGYIPNVDIDIVITGLRPGEKLYEELLLAEEGLEKTTHNKIYVGHPLPAEPRLKELLGDENNKYFEDQLKQICSLKDDEIKQWLHGLVSNYTPYDH